jgi:hypothetical protein
MAWIRRHPIITSVVVLALVLTIGLGTYTIFMAEQAGLEWRFWEPEPTLMPVTPFSDFPGFNTTPAPATPGS